METRRHFVLYMKLLLEVGPGMRGVESPVVQVK